MRPALDALTLEASAPGRPVCGIDEVGRGPWAGPVVAAAVILSPDAIPPGLGDSKVLSPRQRARIAAQLTDRAAIGIGTASVVEIDQLNILRASLLAMERAVAALPMAPGFALVDGTHLPALPCPGRAIPKGDSLCGSIAAAAVIAKVTRDRIMQDLARAHPGYGWETNAGYGTPAHSAALARLGVTPHHRRSFRPVRAALATALAAST